MFGFGKKQLDDVNEVIETLVETISPLEFESCSTCGHEYTSTHDFMHHSCDISAIVTKTEQDMQRILREHEEEWARTRRRHGF